MTDWGLRFSKYATIYTSIYTFVFHDAKICRKYAILSVFLQCVENQSFMLIVPYSALRILHFVLPLGIFRVAVWRLSQLDTCLTVTAWLIWAAPVL